MKGHSVRVSLVIKVPGSDDEIVVLDYLNEPGIHDNLFRIRPDRQEVWRVTAPGPDPDAWTDAELDDGEVVAWSWSKLIVHLDLATGEELSREHVDRS